MLCLGFHGESFLWVLLDLVFLDHRLMIVSSSDFRCLSGYLFLDVHRLLVWLWWEASFFFPLMCPPLGHAVYLSPIMLEKSGLSLGSQTESLITRFGVFHFCTDCFSYGDPDDFIFNHLKGLLSSFSAFNIYFLLFQLLRLSLAMETRPAAFLLQLPKG